MRRAHTSRSRGWLAAASVFALITAVGAVLALSVAEALEPLDQRTAGGAGSTDVGPAVVRASVSPSSNGVRVPRSFLGLSMEYWSFAHDAGLRHPNPLLARFIRALATAGGAAQIRIGGRSADRTWVAASHHARPRWAQTKLNRAWVRRLATVARSTGSGVVAGVNLAAADPRLAAAWAGALARGLPRGHLQALEIGNEPDLYGLVPWYGERVKTRRSRRLVKHFARYRYAFRRFMSEYRRVAGAVRDAVPNARLAGPGFVTPNWVRHLPAFVAGARALGLVELTAHRYPLRRCYLPVGSPEWASLSHLLGDGAAAGTRAVSPYLRLARRRRLSFRIAEMNSLACRGAPSLSDSFASALWGIDTLFELTHAGVSGVNIHTRPLSYYSPLYFHRVAGRWSARVMPSTTRYGCSPE